MRVSSAANILYYLVGAAAAALVEQPISVLVEEDGFSVRSVQVKQSESKRRSLFATQDIKKGEHIWSGVKQEEALFNKGVDFKMFLARIPLPIIACDYLHRFGFVRLLGEDSNNTEDARIGATLDDCTFVNTGAAAVELLPQEDAAPDADRANAGCMPEWKDRYPGGCDQNLFALKDIRAGQEIVVDGEDTTDLGNWFDMGSFLDHERDAFLEEMRQDALMEQMRRQDALMEQMRQEDEEDFHPWWTDYNCNDTSVWTMPRPSYSQDMWIRLRQAYVDIVGSTNSTIGTEVSADDGFVISTEVKQAPGKGRGLFAAEDIPRGQFIWSSKQTASFYSGEDFKGFLDLLELDEACDVLQWSYVDANPGGADEDATQISTDLDNGTLVNHGDEADAGCLPEWEARHPGGCIENVYALRDIKKGEEILVDYGEFAIAGGWSKFGIY
jgi:hypothetical protein